MALHLTWVFAFGLLGNIISCCVCLAPIPTFYQICKKKTSEGFQSIPYIIALFSAMLWLFYAIFKEDTTLLITINSFTFLMEIAYIAIYLFHANKKDMIVTLKLVLLFNVLGFGVVCMVAVFLLQGKRRVEVLGWICMIFSLCVFVAPLCIMRKVIKTKSVEFMPFSLSLFLTLSAVMWFFYGYLKKDHFVAIPNVLGFILGFIQMLLYVIYGYRNPKKVTEEPNKNSVQQQVSEHIVDMDKLSTTIEIANSVVPQARDIIGIEIIGALIDQETKKEEKQHVDMPIKVFV